MRTETRELLAVGIFGRASLAGRIETLLKRRREFSPRASRTRIVATTARLTVLATADLVSHPPGFREARPGSIPPAMRSTPKAEGNPRLEIMNGPMLQTLLEDRFRLTIHRETRDVPVYALETAKSGMKLRPVAEGSCVPLDMDKALTPLAPGRRHPNFCGTGGVSRKGAKVTVQGQAMTLDESSDRLRLVSERPVVNKTAIAGMFDFHLEFVPDEAATGLAPPDDASGPSMFTAIQEQLGLKLEPVRGPGEFLIIDHVEKPDAN
jgi:uncharacterized protein (TIGR03435 family)